MKLAAQNSDTIRLDVLCLSRKLYYNSSQLYSLGVDTHVKLDS